MGNTVEETGRTFKFCLFDLFDHLSKNIPPPSAKNNSGWQDLSIQKESDSGCLKFLMIAAILMFLYNLFIEFNTFNT